MIEIQYRWDMNRPKMMEESTKKQKIQGSSGRTLKSFYFFFQLDGIFVTTSDHTDSRPCSQSSR